MYFQPRAPSPAADLAQSSEHTLSVASCQEEEAIVSTAPRVKVNFANSILSYQLNLTQTLNIFYFIQNLADMFSFDIRQFLDEDDAETTSQSKSPISVELRERLLDIADRLGSSLDALVTNCGPIKSRCQEIQAQLPEDLADIISPAVHLEQHEFKLQRVKQRIPDQLERQSREATIESS